jgi:transcriptional regulator with XRE-family HTH domain
MDHLNHFLVLPMSFPQRLAALRKERGLTQSQMADKIGIHLSQLKRYEYGTSQPTVEVFKRIALALNVSADVLLFEEGERGPDDSLKFQFEAIAQLDDKEREAIETVIASILHMHDAKRWAQAAQVARDTRSSSKKTGRRASVRG